jgi:NADH dehydrogenase FAD-containing subunit
MRIWTAGVKGSTLNGLPQDAIFKEINCNSWNTIRSFKFKFAIGDVAGYASKKTLRIAMLAPVARSSNMVSIGSYQFTT